MANPSNPTNQVTDIKLAHMPLYPTMNSCQSVIDLAASQLPGVSVNTIMTLFMTYHNTLLHKLEQETNYVPRKG
jgi:hypothetical protein